MKRAERALVSVATTVLAGVGLVLTGCSVERESVMKSDKAREQLKVAVDAVQSATGRDWESVTEMGPIGCSPGLEQMAASWEGTATADRDAAYAAVREALEEIGLSTYMLAENSSTPYIGSQTGDGFGLTFAYPIEGKPMFLSVGSDCFPLEEWPDENPDDSGP